MSWNIVEIKKRIAELHERGTLSEEVVNVVLSEGRCAPVECEIIDYKETQDTSPQAIAKLVRHIVSFYNSYGGYLIFGIEETESESVFSVVGVPENIINLESLKAKIREYVGERIQIAGALIPSVTQDNKPCSLYLLFVPKRPEERLPVHFHRDAPGQVFRKNDIYHRIGDECIEAKGPVLYTLSLARPNPYLATQTPWSLSNVITKRIESNLPDRNFICTRFVGRRAVLDELWGWLADDLSHVKMLAGEGGLGKTSIAYEFSDRVSQHPGVPFEQIIWLTAKREQFVGGQDNFVPVPETHYSSYRGLINTIIEHLPILIDTSELGEMSLDELRRHVRTGLSEYPSFVVIDDIDSLDNDQQRQAVELGFLLSSSKSKLLLTTRHNLAYSQDHAIEVDGFDVAEFSEYLDTLFERKILPRALSHKEAERLRALTSGSPLFTESVCRLLRFQAFDDAIKGWSKGAGSRVRAAALDKEISTLSPESKRVLLTVALLSEASVPEVSEVTEYPQEVIEQCLQELSSLFLLAGETLGGRPRFSVPDNTVRLVTERASTLVTDHTRLKGRVTQARMANKAGGGHSSRVGLAIAQAQALLRQNAIGDALRTIDDARKKLRSHPDILGFRAEVLMKFDPPKFDEARRNARDAYQKGCRRPSMFFVWFEAEWLAKHFVGAEEAALAAIEAKLSSLEDWWVKLAAALVSRAEDQKIGVTSDRKIALFFEASKALNSAMGLVRGTESKTWEGILFDVHDRVWNIASRELRDLASIDIAVDSLEKMWSYGDFRCCHSHHAIQVGEAICIYLESPLTRKSHLAIKACDSRMRRTRILVEERVKKYPSDTRNGALLEAMGDVHTRFSVAASHPHLTVLSGG
jgi:hypothetical protein